MYSVVYFIHGYSRQIVEQCPEVELPHYIRSVFEFLTPIGLIPFVFKISESEVLDIVHTLYNGPMTLAMRHWESWQLIHQRNLIWHS